MSSVCVLGLGYVGLPTAAMLATHGHKVTGVDISSAIVDAVNRGETHIDEPGIGALLHAAVVSGNLVARTQVSEADAYIVAVPTPITSNKQPDVSFVEAACRAIAPHLRQGNLVVVESTIPPGTTRGIVASILESSGLKADGDFYLAHCPERVLPGSIFREIVENDRIIGGVTPEAAERAVALYKAFVAGHLYQTDATTAEMVKLAENTFRDVNIALANELARISTQVGVNVWNVIELANKHPRVELLKPGPGVGGHCIPVDPWFLVAAAPEAARLIRTSREINDAQPALVAAMARGLLDHQRHPKVAVLGLTYKADVDDVRESPAIEVIHHLEEAGVQVAAHDPHVRKFFRPLVGLEEAFKDAAAAVLLVDHKAFTKLDPAKLGPLMRARAIVDTKRALDAVRWGAAGFKVSVLGVSDADW